MSWTWRLEAVGGAPMSEPAAPAQQSQSDAETWLGETWRELAAAGVAQVSLHHDGVLVYGPMPLTQ